MTPPGATPNPGLPDEHRLELPPEWLDVAFPRRGKPSARPVTLDPTASDRLAGRIKFWRDDVLKTLEHRKTDPDLAAVAREHLAGRSNPTGAAAVAGLSLTVADRPWKQDVFSEVDAWIADHGLVFAACAAVELIGMAVFTSHLANVRARGLNGMPDSGRAVAEIKRARAHLAVASETEYRSAVAAIGSHRTCPLRRVAAAFIAPTEQDWVNQVCRDARAIGYYDHYGSLGWLLYSTATEPGQLAAAGLKHFGPWEDDPSSAASLIEGMESESLPFLTGNLGFGRTHEARQMALEAISLLPSDEAMRFLLEHHVEDGTFAASKAAAARFPVRALRITAALAPNASAAHRARLAGIARTNPHLDAALAELDGDSRGVIEALVGDAAPVASVECLPRLLAAPPWTVKRPNRKAVVIEGLEAPAGLRLAWAEGEREQWKTAGEHWDEEFWDQDVEHRRDEAVRDARFYAYASAEVAAPLLSDWDGSSRYREYTDVYQRILARHGDAATRPVLAAMASDTDLHELLPPISGLEAARLAADWLRRKKSARRSAQDWLDRHGEDAARQLIPDALGKAKALRTNAEAALRYLAESRGADTVLIAAETYCAEAADALRPLTEIDPLEIVGGKVPKPGDWTDPGMLPPVLLRENGAALPEGALRHLMTTLALSTPDEPYVGVDVLAEHCDPDSLARFSLGLFELWMGIEAPSKEGWALRQLGNFGDDEAVRRLTPLIRRWPGESQHKRAVTALGVLGAIGSEAALRAIHGISQKVKFSGIKDEAAQQIEAIATGLGLSADQLGDRLAPDFGLGEESVLVLDYGPRQFKVGFDEQLKPFVTAADGKPLKSLPKPGVKDDAEIAEASRKRFTQLKKDVRAVASEQIRRLERAMINGRTWTSEEFRTLLVDHALVRHLVRRLVWVSETEDGRTAFRVEEDRTFAGPEDERFELPSAARIRLAHPMLLDEEVQTWASIFADYEILQPFAQLARTVMVLTPEELATGRLARFEGAEVSTGRVLELTDHGWHRIQSGPDDGEPGLSRELADGGCLNVELSPGLFPGYLDRHEVHTLTRAYHSPRDLDWNGDEERARAFGEIDPVEASESLLALTKLTETR
ncbi:DUF4132 domain-containing protein [Glycomyces buryatensis]|uniref:DUF4132 domain-containing protein n=1 Tax=Glycomyces buryatensis TaxID=2570927 RepID=A0A4S8Q326_9ACTN|nr:DUF4132 domain-containing protein [Glycomyces buryatensis]THV38508.1 DUF4132 domain-containing protein [Glycomyces buryatensis]